MQGPYAGAVRPDNRAANKAMTELAVVECGLALKETQHAARLRRREAVHRSSAHEEQARYNSESMRVAIKQEGSYRARLRLLDGEMHGKRSREGSPTQCEIAGEIAGA